LSQISIEIEKEKDNQKENNEDGDEFIIFFLHKKRIT